MDAEPAVPPHESRVIAGFWRRLVAFFLDCLLLGVIGAVVGYFFFQPLVDIGPWGRLLGFAVALPYFGILNGSVGGGQTIGKRYLKVKVIAADGSPLRVSKSLLRFLVLGTPWFLNNAQFPEWVLFTPWIYALSIATFGLGLSIVYLYVFNRRSRQSLHDLIVGSFVVKAEAKDATTVAAPWRPHLVVCAALMLTFAIVPYFTMKLADTEPFVPMIAASHAVQSEPGVMYARVSTGRTSFASLNEGRRDSTYFSVVAYLKDPDIDNTGRAKRLARAALAADPSARSIDQVNVTLIYGYDIGIASGWKSRSYVHRPAEWLAP